MGALRVATYNIHKGVRGIGPGKRLEIHNLSRQLQSLQADVLMLQEVRAFHHREARRFAHGPQAWPQEGQAEFLAPAGWHVAYRTNAVTRHGEHGNALLSRHALGEVRHRDVSDHRLEQRGLLHVPVHRGVHMAHTAHTAHTAHSMEHVVRSAPSPQPEPILQTVHAVVVHFGLIHASRVRQTERLLAFIEDEIPKGAPLVVGGDFNDWGERLDEGFAAAGLHRAKDGRSASTATFPSRVPVFALDRFYIRGLRCTGLHVPRGMTWSRLSDHLPLVGEFEVEPEGAPEAVPEGGG